MKKYENIEGTRIEYKEKVKYKRPKSWLKSISAFSNTSDGKLIFGIRDYDKAVIGLNDIYTDSEKVSELINAKITPLPRHELKSLKEDDKDVLEVKVGDGPYTPYYYNSDGVKEAYVRAGDESIVAPKYMLDNLILKGQNVIFDKLPTDYTMEDVSFTLLRAKLKKETGIVLKDDKDFISLDLLTLDGHITSAGLLLSDDGLLSQSRIFCTRWNGLTKSSGTKDALDDKEYSGSIISLLSCAEDFIKTHNKVSWGIQGLKRVETPEYPKDAVREAIVNAIIHRDYQIIGSEIHIDIFDDRLEITSPGGMVNGTLIQNLDIKRVPSMRRNKVISDIFSRLEYMERRGSGLVKIFTGYKNKNIKPYFYSTAFSFTVVFPNASYTSNDV